MTDGTGPGGSRNVVITGIDVPFGQLVVYMIKVALAAVPALVVLWLALQVIWLIAGAVLGHPLRPWRRWDW